MTLWYLARASGIVAMLMLTLSTTLGLIASIRPAASDGRTVERRVHLQYAHRSVAVTGLALVGVHVATLVADALAGVTVSQAFVPLTASYRPAAVGLGTVALYLFILAAVAGAARGRLSRSPRAAGGWRFVHAAAYVGWGLSIGHAVLTGTDATQPWMLAFVVGSASTVFGALSLRLRSQAAHIESGLAAARSGAATSQVRTGR